MVIDDRVEVAPELLEQSLAPVMLGAAHPHDEQQRRAVTGAGVAELDVPCPGERHSEEDYTGALKLRRAAPTRATWAARAVTSPLLPSIRLRHRSRARPTRLRAPPADAPGRS